MDAESIRLLATAGAIAVGATAPAIAIGYMAAKGLEAIGRNPEAAPKIQTAMILAIAFAEAIAFYARVGALIIKFVKSQTARTKTTSPNRPVRAVRKPPKAAK